MLSAGRTEAPAETLSGLVVAQLRHRSAAPAVSCGGDRISYGELDRWSGTLAATLHARGVGHDDVVAVRTGRCVELVVAALAVLRAGAAYLPVSPDEPPERLATLVADAGVRLVVTMPALAPSLRAPSLDVVVVDRSCDGDAPARHSDRALADAGAYVISTSGSTGRPKAVLVDHRAAARHVGAMVDVLDLRPDDVVLQMAGAVFDVAVEQLFTGLAAGAHVVMRDERPWGPAEVCASVRDHGVTVADLPTALFVELGSARHSDRLPADLGGLRVLVVGGEALPAAALDAWRAALGDAACDVLNAYGPTEAVMTASTYRGPTLADEAGVPLGGPVGPRCLQVLDAALAPIAPGGAGELHVGGACLARGYVGRPDLTAERFVPDPTGRPGARMYRTGDRVRRVGAEGDLVFAGRVDDQLKVRGHRIEPQEIERVLAAHPRIAAVAVTAHADRLVAHLVPAGERPPAPAELACWAGARLPAWMVPDRWCRRDRLPHAPSGKVDRQRLHDDAVDPTAAPGPGTAPRTALESTLAGIWARALDLHHVGVDQRYLDLGGNSLRATRVQADVMTELDVALPLEALLSNPTVATLARTVATAGDAGPALPPVHAEGTGVGTVAPLSVMQEQVLYFAQYDPSGVAYHAPTTIRLRGPLRVDLLRRALDDLVRRHEILRTTIDPGDGDPLQRVHAPYHVEVPVDDLRGEADPEAVAERLVETEIRRPFDLTRLPLIRFRLLRLADDDHQLVLVEHHVVHDGWSFALLIDDLLATYAAQLEPLPQPPRDSRNLPQYADFARWQRRALAGPVLRSQLDHWVATLRGAPARLDLPYDHERRPERHLTGAVHRVELPPHLCTAVRRFSREHGVTLYTTMLAAFAALLHRVTDQDEIAVGSAFGNRAVRGTQDIIGMFVNTVVLRCRVPGHRRFAELLDDARSVVLDAQAHQEVPYASVVRALAPDRRPGENPLFAAMLNFDDAPLAPLRAGPVTASYLERHNGSAKLDLSVLVVPRAERQLALPPQERDQRITMIWEYRSDLFESATIEALDRAFVALLTAAVADASMRVDALPVGGATAPPAIGAPDPRAFAGLGAHEVFARVAEERPDAVAVSWPGTAGITYGELDRRSNRLAHALRARGVGAEDVVALPLPRGTDLIAAMLGTLKAGAAYLPLDVDSPPARLADLLTDVRPAAVVGATVPDVDVPVVIAPDDAAVLAAPDTRPELAVAPDQLAYLVFTSGSTGRPKAVGVSHRALVRKYLAWADVYDLGPEDVHLQTAAVAFDVCTGDIVRALLSGGRLVLCPRDVVLDPALLADALADGITCVELLPSVAAMLATHLAGAARQRRWPRLIAVGGETWTPADHRRLRRAVGPEPTILNVFGVTEATIGNTVQVLPADDAGRATLPIGSALPDVTARVVTARGDTAPPGIVGEIVLGGAGLARGYRGRPAATAERFVPDPSASTPGARAYRTGDRGRHLVDGRLEHLHRDDRQVKIRGVRVEPAELEHALRRHPAVADAAVMALHDPNGVRLAAYVTGSAVDEDVLLDDLRAQLPAHLVPATVRRVATIPRTASGKVDLPSLPPTAPTGRGSRAPRTAVERTIAAVWCEVLDVASVGADDAFFDVGGHSLLAAKVAARLRAALGVTVSVRDVLDDPTIAGAARRLAGRSASDVVGPRPRPRRRDAYAVDETDFDEVQT